MLILRQVKIRQHERGLLFRDHEFRRLLNPGRHWIWGLPFKVRVERVSVREVYFHHQDLEVIVRSGALEGQAEVLDLKDSQRALVWIDGRFGHLLGPGLQALWTAFHEVRVEMISVGPPSAGLDAGDVRLEHESLAVILASEGHRGRSLLEQVNVEAGHAALLFRDGRHVDTLVPGTYALWRDAGRLRVLQVDLREQVLDVAGQDVMTADKVTLRLNAVLTYKVADAAKAVTSVEDYAQALYREAQLALRAVIGTRELDALLAEKDAVARELDQAVGKRVASFGLEIVSLGIRDLILPGEMRDLMNRVTEAKKAAEANFIARREETAAMRSQANTAKILEANPMLMKLKELEVLEKVAADANLSVVLTETGLGDRVLKLV